MGKGFRQEDFWDSFCFQNYFVLLAQRIAKLELSSDSGPKLYVITFILDIHLPDYEFHLLPQCTLIYLHARCLFKLHTQEASLILPFVPYNSTHSCTLLLTQGCEGQKNLKCSVLYLDSKAAAAMSAKPSVAHFAVGRRVPDIRCGESQVTRWNYPLLGG